MAVMITDGTGVAGGAAVDADRKLEVATTLLEAKAGFVTLAAENDSGSITAERYTRALEVTADFRLRTAVDTMLHNEQFANVALNTDQWFQAVTTMTATVATGFLNQNAGLSTANAAVSRTQTYRHFPIYKTFTTQVEAEVQFSQTPQVNSVCEWGLFLSTGVTAPTDGVFFRLNAAGEFRCIVSNNGTETVSAALSFASLVGTNTTKQFLIYAGSTVARFWIDNILVAVINRPAGQGALTSSMNLPLAFRNYNSGVTAAAQVMRVGNTNVTLGDQATGKPWPHVIAGAGGNGALGQTGATIGQTCNYNNGSNPAPAVPTNTTAALGTGLGGQFWETDTLAVTSDGIISSYQVPAGTSLVPGKSFYCTGIKIDSYVQTALTGGGYCSQWILAFGHTAVSLATAEGIGTKAPRRIPLGVRAVAAGALANTIVGDTISVEFAAPVVVAPGQFIATAKKKVGVAPSAGVIAHVIAILGYWE